jgi:alpha-beta hydrolase superfamily lysophospholipase
LNSVPTWVLLRGLTRESGHWGAFPQLLREQLAVQQPGIRVMTLDLPGNGSLYRQTSPSRVPDLVQACRDELRRRGCHGPVYLLAMSLGGMVACEWALSYPQEVAGAVLINTSMRPALTLRSRVRPLSYWKLLAGGLLSLSGRWREARVLAATSRMVDRPREVLDAWVDLQRRHPVAWRNGFRQLLAALRYQASRGRPQAPMLLLCSQVDDLVDWRCSQALSRAWGAPLRMHTQAGHDLALDDPPWVARAVGDWLRAQQMHAMVIGGATSRTAELQVQQG